MKEKKYESPVVYVHCFLKQIGVIFFFFFFFCFFWAVATPEAYDSSQTKGQIRAAAASLSRSHSNMGSKPRLWSTLQLTAVLDP